MTAIYGIGTDIVQVKRFAASLQRFGQRIAHRILTDTEYLAFQKNPRPAHFLAKRFAAKEAAAKALGLGIRQGLSFKQINVSNDKHGKPSLEYTGKAAQFCLKQGIKINHLSIADEKDYAVAFVTLEIAE